MKDYIRKDLDGPNDKICGRKYFEQHNCCEELDITFNIFHDIYYIFNAANFNLINAANKDLDISKYETNAEDILRFFLRLEYLKSTILSYRSIEDYIMKIIAFAFNLKDKITSKEDYENKSKNIYYRKIHNKLSKKQKDKEISKINQIIEKFHEDENFKKIRDLVNKLKHNNNIKIKELRPACSFGYSIKNKSNKIIYSSDWLESETYSIEELVDLCYKANPVIVNYIEDIYSIIVTKYSDYPIESL